MMFDGRNRIYCEILSKWPFPTMRAIFTMMISRYFFAVFCCDMGKILSSHSKRSFINLTGKDDATLNHFESAMYRVSMIC
jgi:hypothetical protein